MTDHRDELLARAECPIVLGQFREDGTPEFVYFSHFPDVMQIDAWLLEKAQTRWVTQGDGIATIHATNGDVSYGLIPIEGLRSYLGIRSPVPLPPTGGTD